MASRPLKTFNHDPDANLDYSVNWEDWLEDDDDTISSVVWVVPDGMTKTSQSSTDTIATVWLSGGTEGQQYNVVCRITTAGGRTEDRTIRLKVVEK